MSEEDYQRGLRGGDCPVSISEWERYSDWKAGYDEYDRRLQRGIDTVLRDADEARAARASRKFDCPFCLEPVLRDGAKRCPRCRSDIQPDYWVAARAERKAEDDAEREAEAQAEAEYERTVAERRAGREATEAEEARRAQAAEVRANASEGCLIGPVFGAILLGLVGCVSCVRGGSFGSPLLTTFNLLTGLFYGAILGAIVGPLIGIAIANAKR